MHKREKEKARELTEKMATAAAATTTAAAARVAAEARVGGSSSGSISVLIESASEEMDLSTRRES